MDRPGPIILALPSDFFPGRHCITALKIEQPSAPGDDAKKQSRAMNGPAAQLALEMR
jgi:hypothetical protein